ncbi:nucleotidyltransferase [Flavobacterium kingsejongi]|uniref:Nucleotidyltransferase n=1 Tax=Flavobacterium kingsejongi TaxID=1678728 RepID=A0A2S1LM43_9FLAO|nr:nucleotidyltransferase [Flavobacterium kingsejongi]AWG24830.1 hypothetical protein FK004_06095 [Flavobacterium kingsejongi]
MARPVNEIQQEIVTSIAANEHLQSLNSSSNMAVFKIIAFIVAYAIWLLEMLFDVHVNEITDLLTTQKAGTLSWYRTMALRFQFGFSLVSDHDYFDNGTATDDEIEASKIVKYSAVNESTTASRVIIKIAGESGGVLTPITPGQKESFETYINEIRFAGVAITVINYRPDLLFLNIKIQRNALLLDENGMNILQQFPVNEAIEKYLKELPFNGELKLSALLDRIQVAEGVLDVTIMSASSASIDPSSSAGDYGEPQPIVIRAIPESGYYVMDSFNNISYYVV